MKTTRFIAAALLIFGSAMALHVAQAQTGITRTDVQRSDLGVSGREVIQVRVDLAPCGVRQAFTSGRGGRVRP